MQDMKWRVAKTVFRTGRLPASGIFIHRNFGEVQIPAEDLMAYRTLLGIESRQPLSFLYLLAQRAQVALMTDSLFLIRIPGLVHLENSLIQEAPIDFKETFTLKVQTEVAFKKEGSLIPKFHVGFFQNDHQVAFCESTYLSRRKKSGPKKKSSLAVLPDGRVVIREGFWDVLSQKSGDYARVSGDANPIHTKLLIARMMGFQGLVMHGWYGVSRIVNLIEDLMGHPVKFIDCQFRAPVILPTRVRFEIWLEDEMYGFALFFGVDDQLCTTGRAG